MTSKFIIYGRLDGLNEYTKSNRSNKYKGNKTKQDNEYLVSLYIRQAKLKRVFVYPLTLKITWYEKNKRRDVDNITFATKVIHDVKVDKNNPRIEVEIIEM